MITEQGAGLPKLADLHQQPAGRVYVLLLDSGRFKVGKSFNLRSRLTQVRSEIRSFQRAEVIDGWYSLEHETYHASEVRLLAFCLERFGAPVYGAEVFEGDYDAAVAQAERITAETASCPNCASSSLEGATA